MSCYEQSSFPVIHKIDNNGIFVLLKSENELDKQTNHFNLKSKYYNIYIFAFKPTCLLDSFQFISIRSCTKRQTLLTYV